MPRVAVACVAIAIVIWPTKLLKLAENVKQNHVKYACEAVACQSACAVYSVISS